MTLTPPTPASPPSWRARFARRGLRTFLFCIAIAALLALLGNAFWSTLVHSLCTGMLCWLAIDLGRLPLSRWAHRHAPAESPEALSHWPGWPLMLVSVVVGTAFGFGLGDVIARWLLGQAGGTYFSGGWREAALLLVGPLVPGLLLTYYFYSGETLAAKEAAVQTAQRQAAEHQLKLLESQLEPHMLFNTLATLRVLIGSDPKRAQTMLDQLIGFLRGTLGASRVAAHPLRLEFERLADYLALMQTRMGARLQTRFDLPTELAGLNVPPLLLQPLVENCIKHGLEPKVEGGRIEVAASRDGAALVLTVRDTGIGLAAAAGDGTRFGLVQVRERLATLYGPGATLALAASGDAEGGTLATIRLPLDALRAPSASAT